MDNVRTLARRKIQKQRELNGVRGAENDREEKAKTKTRRKLGKRTGLKTGHYDGGADRRKEEAGSERAKRRRVRNDKFVFGAGEKGRSRIVQRAQLPTG